MKTAIILSLLVAVAVAAFVIWKRRSRPSAVDNLEFKDGEVAEINLSDLDPHDPLAKMATEVAGKQAAGLGGATVTIHSVKKIGLGYWRRIIVDHPHDVLSPQQPPPLPTK